MEEAAKFDRKIVIEQGVGGKKEKAREIECSVLGNDEPKPRSRARSSLSKNSTTTTPSIWTKARSLIIPAKLTKAETKKNPATRDRGFQGGRLLGPGARRFPDGPEDPQDLSQRNQYHAGIHLDQHVSQAVGGIGLEYPD